MYLSTLQNNHWYIGILPQTGASIAFGKVKQGDEWVDILRPTPASDYGNSSSCSSFIMLPWCNRIKNGVLRFQEKEYQLRTTKDDGTARHGDTRGRSWRIDQLQGAFIRMSLRSDFFSDMNWPFKFSAWVEYSLESRVFSWTLAIKNEDARPFPAGFGHHPYFSRREGMQIQVPCQQYFELTDFMATRSPIPIKPELDFRQLRALPEAELNDLLTGREGEASTHIHYPKEGIQLDMHSDSIFEHILVFAPKGKPFAAIEPMSNASDGFNLTEQSIPGSGVFVLQPGEEKIGRVALSIL